MRLLRQSTAVSIGLGPFLDDADGKTAEGGLTITQADIRLKKNDANWGQKSDTSSATHEENGWYEVALNATDTGTLGQLLIAIHESGALPVWERFMVVPAVVYDALVAGTDYLQVDLLQMGGVTQSATDLKDFADDGYDPATNKVQGVVLVDTTTTNTDLVSAASIRSEMDTNSTRLAAIETDTQDIQGRLPSALVGGRMDSNLSAIGNDAQSATDLKDFADAGYDPITNKVQGVVLVDTTTTNTDMVSEPPTAVAIRTEMDTNSTKLIDILADTNELQTDDVPGLIGALNDVSTTEVKAQADQALVDIHLDHLLAADYDPATKPGTATALLNELVESDVGVSRFTANALEQAPTGGSAPTVVEIRQEMDANSTQLAAIVADTGELQTDWADGGRLDNILDARAASSEISALNDISPAEVNTEVASALATYDGPTHAELQAEFTTIKGATWDSGTDTLEAIRDKETDIETDTQEIGVAGAGLTNLGDTRLANLDATVNSRASSAEITALNDVSTTDLATALTDIHLDHLLAADYDPATKPGVGTALLNELVESDSGVSRFTANALEQAPGGTGANPNVLADTTINSVTSQTEFTLTAGSDVDDAYNSQAIVLYDASNSDYPSIRVVTDYVGSTKTVTIDGAPDFTIIGGDGVKVFVTAPGSTAPTVQQIRTEMDTNSTQLAAIVADTNELQTDWVNGGRLDTILDATATSSEISALNDISAAEVNTQVDLALADYDGPTHSELQSEFTTIKGATFDSGTDTLEAIRNKETDIETDTQDIQSRLPAALVGGKMNSDATAISGDTTAADNLEATFDGTGYTDPTAPATQSQLDNMAIVAGAPNKEASSYLLTTGSLTSGTYTDTRTENNVKHVHADTAGALDLYYQFLIGGDGVPVTVTIKGHLTGLNDTIAIQVYDWVATQWDTLQSWIGSALTDNVSITKDLYTSHVGTGADAGKVRIRFYAASGLTTAQLGIDQIFVSYAVIARSVGYADGAIWVNTNGSNTNVEPYVDGTADNPVSTWAAALSLSASLGITRFHINGNSSITLTASSSAYDLIGDGMFSLNLNGQAIDNSYVRHARVSGTGSGNGAVFEDCEITANASTGPSFFVRCGFNTPSGSPYTANGAGEYSIIESNSLVAGSGTPYLDFSGTGGTTGVNIRKWSGGSNITLDSNNTLSLEVQEGGGQTITTGGASCEIRGICRALTVVMSAAET